MIKAGGWCSQHHPRPPFRGRVRPLISRAYPAGHQVPRLVHATHPRLVPAAFILSLARAQELSFVEARPRSRADQSQQKVSNRPVPVATRAPDAVTREHVTAPVDTDRHALRAFGTKRPWVQIPPPRHAETPGHRPPWGKPGLPFRRLRRSWGELKFSQQPALPEQGIQHSHWRAHAVVHPLIERSVPQVGEPV